MGNAVVHFEFTTTDPEALGNFYAEVLGWHTQSIPGDYVMIDTHSGRGINGGIGKGDTNIATVYVEVDDLEPALEKIESLGGKTETPPVVMPGVVSFAKFTDPSGNVVGLVKSEPDSDAPGVSEGDNPPVDWFEILGTDGKALRKFYTDAFGWDLKDSGVEGIDYFMFQEPEKGSPGAVGSTPDGQPAVRFYAGVSDLKEILEKAETLGAKTLMEPSQVAPETEIAIFADPQGNVFGLFRS
jgi:predicted enzyme related to lactoylglutathione lyase